MRAVITGAAGFIGSTLVDRLLADGHDVVGVDSMTDYYSPTLKRANIPAAGTPRFEFIERDLTELGLDALLDGADAVFHLAGQPGVRSSWGDGFQDYVRRNVNATQQLLEAARRAAEPPKIVYASSSSIYGEAETYPTHEGIAPQPRSPYGVTKLAAEHLCRVYAASFGVSTVSLRFFTVYGPRQRPDMAFTRFLRAAVAGERIAVYGNGRQVRDFTFVDDVVEAIVGVGSLQVPPGSVYNVSGGGSHSVNDVLEHVEELVGRRLEIERRGVALGDVSRTAGDITAIGHAIDWAPRVGLRDGLRRQMDWVESTA